MKNGGPAFPCELPLHAQEVAIGIMRDIYFNGMSLRDYFAAKAMQGLIKVKAPHEIGQARQSYADEAYLLADAMLAARKE